ncbi:MAG: hypothetical protein OD811_03625 [Alphaproteobacteria bacterium]
MSEKITSTPPPLDSSTTRGVERAGGARADAPSGGEVKSFRERMRKLATEREQQKGDKGAVSGDKKHQGDLTDGSRAQGRQGRRGRGESGSGREVHEKIGDEGRAQEETGESLAKSGRRERDGGAQSSLKRGERREGQKQMRQVRQIRSGDSAHTKGTKGATKEAGEMVELEGKGGKGGDLRRAKTRGAHGANTQDKARAHGGGRTEERVARKLKQDTSEQEVAREVADRGAHIVGETASPTLTASTAPSSVQAAPLAASAESREALLAAVNKVADRISFVAADASVAGGARGGMVRIELQDKVLPSTTLEIQRGNDGVLTLTFVTDAGASSAVLRAHGEALASHVEAQTGTQISVRLLDSGSSAQVVGGVGSGDGGADTNADAGSGQSRGRENTEATLESTFESTAGESVAGVAASGLEEGDS